MSDEQNKINPEQEDELSAKESFKLFMEKLGPYIQKILAAKKKLIIINGSIAVISGSHFVVFC